MSWRRIALKADPDGECPDPGAADRSYGGPKWKITHLFKVDGISANPRSKIYAENLPRALRPFCLYEYKKDEPEVLNDLNHQLDHFKELIDVDYGCAVVAPMASLSKAEAPSSPEDYFLRQVGGVDPVTLDAGSLRTRSSGQADPEPRVNLVFLDTQPRGKLGKDVNSEHGYTLAQMARKIVCDASEDGADSCTAKIGHELALHIEAFDRESPTNTTVCEAYGGFFGSVDRLATAVWETLKKNPPHKRLVLNLSIAWVGEGFGGLEEEVSDMRVSVQALHRALEVASCRDALVVAAAGNRVGGPEAEYGPLLPGGWERRDAPSPSECRTLLQVSEEDWSPRPRWDESKEPLVYAAAGVRFDNSPLHNIRPGANSPRVAYADRAIVGEPGDMPALTGSSVGSAVVSAVAAATWHHWPYLDRAELMDLLYDAGKSLGRNADFYHEHWQEPPDVRRIGLCQTFQLACGALGGPCPGPCEPFPAEPPLPESSSYNCADGKSVDGSKIASTLPPIPLCGDRTIYYDPAAGLPVGPCLSQQYYDAAAWAWQSASRPQPTDDACGSCSIGKPGGIVKMDSAGYILRIHIDEHWGMEGKKCEKEDGERGKESEVLSQVFLDIGTVSLALGLGEMKAGDCAVVENIASEHFAGEPKPSATLRFLTSGRRVITIPLLY